MFTVSKFLKDLQQIQGYQGRIKNRELISQTSPATGRRKLSHAGHQAGQSTEPTSTASQFSILNPCATFSIIFRQRSR